MRCSKPCSIIVDTNVAPISSTCLCCIISAGKRTSHLCLGEISCFWRHLVAAPTLLSVFCSSKHIALRITCSLASTVFLDSSRIRLTSEYTWTVQVASKILVPSRSVGQNWTNNSVMNDTGHLNHMHAERQVISVQSPSVGDSVVRHVWRCSSSRIEDNCAVSTIIDGNGLAFVKVNSRYECTNDTERRL
jgi:hypothetical protein